MKNVHLCQIIAPTPEIQGNPEAKINSAIRVEKKGF
jgi:hypothetical protein